MRHSSYRHNRSGDDFLHLLHLEAVLLLKLLLKLGGADMWVFLALRGLYELFDLLFLNLCFLLLLHLLLVIGQVFQLAQLSLQLKKFLLLVLCDLLCDRGYFLKVALLLALLSLVQDQVGDVIDAAVRRKLQEIFLVFDLFLVCLASFLLLSQDFLLMFELFQILFFYLLLLVLLLTVLNDPDLVLVHLVKHSLLRNVLQEDFLHVVCDLFLVLCFVRDELLLLLIARNLLVHLVLESLDGYHGVKDLRHVLLLLVDRLLHVQYHQLVS